MRFSITSSISLDVLAVLFNDRLISQLFVLPLLCLKCITLFDTDHLQAGRTYSVLWRFRGVYSPGRAQVFVAFRGRLQPWPCFYPVLRSTTFVRWFPMFTQAQRIVVTLLAKTCTCQQKTQFPTLLLIGLYFCGNVLLLSLLALVVCATLEIQLVPMWSKLPHLVPLTFPREVFVKGKINLLQICYYNVSLTKECHFEYAYSFLWLLCQPPPGCQPCLPHFHCSKFKGVVIIFY